MAFRATDPTVDLVVFYEVLFITQVKQYTHQPNCPRIKFEFSNNYCGTKNVFVFSLTKLDYILVERILYGMLEEFRIFRKKLFWFNFTATAVAAATVNNNKL